MSAGAAAPEGDFSAYVAAAGDGTAALSLLVPDVHCVHCISKIERTMRRHPGVVDARVNLSTRRMRLSWRRGEADPGSLVAEIEALGYPAVPYDPAALADGTRAHAAFLLRCLAVAGFAAANVMLLSVSVWAGAFSDMDATTRDLMHWFSALVALPAIAYAGRPFFRSAAAALAARRMNMDVPISLAVAVAAGVSLYEVIGGGPHAWFDAAIMLLFFLLIGRYLDLRTRGAMRSTAENLASLAAQPASVIAADGHRIYVPARSVAAGALVLVAAGERLPVDGTLVSGATEIDAGLLTGETAPVRAAPGDRVYAGTVNLGDAITLRATAAGEGTVLAEIVRLVENAEQTKSSYVRLADRAARLYAPLVHLAAAAAFLGWYLIGGMTVHDALLIGVAVLIITCPCALGLAVPAVQVTASGRLMRTGVLVKSGDALERLAAADTVVLDKTGTLTVGRPELETDGLDAEALAAAASLAAASNHPLCRALVRAAGPVAVRDGVIETAGMGLAADGPAGESRLGNRDWCGIGDEAASAPEGRSELWLRRPGGAPVRFGFADALRPDARGFVDWLRGRGMDVRLVSGDNAAAVARVASVLGIDDWRADVRPDEKLRYLEALQGDGRRVAMVGDGLNDAPSLAAAFVSLSPSSGADIAQTAADIVFQSERLAPVADAFVVARRARRLVGQNFALAAGYNLVAVPLAVAGLVTPLVAAVAMSASSIVVTLNALRLARARLRPLS